MDWKEYLQMAYRNLTASKGRSFLTMLGVIIGIFSVITLVSLGEGLKGYMYDQIEAMGTGDNYLEIHAGKGGGIGFFGAEITYKDAKAIESQAKAVESVDARALKTGTFVFGNREFKAPMVMG
ncbi:MAG: ABC transporter permease, partial [bacterium]